MKLCLGLLKTKGTNVRSFNLQAMQHEPTRSFLLCNVAPAYASDVNDIPQSIGVARIFGWGGRSHKSHAMTSSEIFKKGTFCGAKVS